MQVRGNSSELDCAALDSTTEIALLDAQPITAKIDGEDRLTRIYPSFPEAGPLITGANFDDLGGHDIRFP